MNIFDPHITGSLSVSASAHIEGDLTVLGTIRGVAELTGEVGSAISASHAASYLLTSSFEGVSGSFAITGSNNFKGDQTISGSLLPEGTLVHNIGSDSQRWNDIYLAGNTIDIGGTKISKTDGGDVELKDSSNVLKKLIASEIQIGSGPNAKTLKVSNGRFKLTGLEDVEEGLANLSGSFTGSFSGDGSQLTNVPASGVTGLSLDSISSGSNSLTMGETVLVSNVSILPNITDTIDLGSPTKQWRDLFLSSGSLYINGQQVLSTTGDELRITTDTGESIKIIETSTDTITLQTEDGDITLTASGNGNIELDAPIQIGAGNKILSSDGNEIQFGNGLSVTGSVVLTGTVDGVDIAGLNTSFNSFTSSTNGAINVESLRINSLEEFTASIDDTYASDTVLNTYTSSNDGRVNSLETTSGSHNGRLDSLETESGSVRGTLNTFTSSIDTTIKSKLNSETVLSGSIQVDITGTTNYDQVTDRLDSVENFTSSVDGQVRSDFNTYTASNDSDISTLETHKTTVEGGLEFTGSNVTIKGNLLVKGTETRVNSTTVDLDDNIISLNGTGASDAGIEVRDVTSPGILSGSLLWDGVTNYWKGGTKGNEERLLDNSDLVSLDGRLDSIETTTSSFDGRLDSIETTTSSLDGRLDSVETTTSSFDGRLDSLETTTGSLKSQVSSLEGFTASIDDTYASDSDVTTLRTDLNTYTSSNDTNINTLDGRLDSLETESGSVKGRLEHIEIATGSLSSDISTLDSRLDSVETKTGSYQDGYDYSQVGHLPLSGGTITGSLEVRQTEDSNGIKIFGYDDRSTYSGNIYIDSAGNFKINQTHGVGSGYIQIGAENYLSLDAASLVYTSSTFRIYDAGRLDFGSSGDYKIKYNASDDNLVIHTNDNLGITLDSVGNTTFTGTVSASGYNDGNWNTAYGWGDHSTEGYIKSFTNTNEFVSGVTFNTSDGVLTFTRNNGGDTFTVDIDGRHVLKGGDTMTGTLIVPKLQIGNATFSPSGDQNHVHFVGTALIPNTLTTSANSMLGTSSYRWIGIYGGIGNFSGTVTGNSFVKVGGTSSQFLKADGSVDSSTYLTDHPSVVASASSNNSGRTYIQDILLDSFGHITGLTTATETVVNTDTNYFVTGHTWNSTTGILTTTLNNGSTTNVNLVNTLSDVTVTGGTYASGTQILTLTKNDGSTVDVSGFAIDTDVNWYTTGSTFNSTNGVITFTRSDGGTYTVDIDGRYLTSYTETDTLDSVTDRGSTTTNGITVGELTTTKISTSTDSNLYLYPTGNGHLYLGDSGNGMNMYHYSQQNNGKYTTFTHNGTYYRISPTATSGLEITSNTRITGTLTASGYNDANWNTAYGWGNHASAGYITSFTDTNEFTTGSTFNSANGVITFTRNNGGDTYTVGIDGRYVPLAGGTMTGDLTVQTYLKLGVGSNGYFYSDIAGRTAFAGGEFYIQDNVGTYYNYATNQYHGASSGDNHYFRGNPLSGNNWNITASGVITATGGNSTNWNTAYGWGNHAGLYSLLNHTHTFASLTSKPTTLSGYGITDAATSTQGSNADTAFGWGNHASVGYLTSFSESDTLHTVLGRNNVSTRSMTIGSTLNVTADGGSNYTASRIYLNSHNDARGLGVFMSGVGSTWYAGTPYGNHAGSYIISRKGTVSDEATANPTHALFTLTNTGNLSVDGTLTASGYNDGNWNTAYGWGNHANTYSLLNHTHTFASLTSKPTTLSGYGITDAASSTHTHTFASLTSKPTTLSGYGITDAASSANVSNWDTAYGWGNHASVGYLTSFTETNSFLGGGGGANTHPGTNRVIFTGQVSAGSGALGMPTVDNSNAFLNINRHSGEYNSQLGFSSNGHIYYRKFSAAAINGTQPWLQVYHSGVFTNNSSNWNTAYGWGNHASAGYISSFTDTNEFVTGATFNSGNGIVTFTRNNGGDTFTLNLASTLTDVTVTGGTYTSGTQTLRLTKSDGNTIDVSGFAIDTDTNTNNYTTGATFNTGNGIITGTLNGGATWTVDIDGKYSELSHNHDDRYFQDNKGSISLTGSNPFDDSKTETRVTGSGSYVINYTGASAHLFSSNVGGSASMFQIGAHYNGSDFYMRTRTDGSTWQTWKQLWHSGDFTTTNISNWNTAYGWGNHASAGYITSPNGGDATTLDGIDSTQFLRSDVSDTHTGTLTVNGQFIFNSSLNSSYREGIMLNVSTTGWGGAVFGGVRDSISGITDAWWVARNPSKDFVISYGTSANSGGLYLPYNSSALEYKNNRIWNAADFANNSTNWNTAYGWGNHASGGYATLSGSNSFTNSYNEFGNGTGSVSNDGSWNARVNIAGTSHARLDVKSVSDGIITSIYSHIGNGAGKMGTMSNHPLKLMVAGSDMATLDSGGGFTLVGGLTSTTVNTGQGATEVHLMNQNVRTTDSPTFSTLNATSLVATSTVSGSTVLDIQGTQGQLFSITDDLTGDLFSVSDSSGVPIFNVNANGTVSIDTLGLLTVGGSITGTSFVKSGGTSSQFLKADGSVDSTTYLSTLPTHTHTFASLTSKPTTLSGYGITDAASSTNVSNWDTAYGWGNHASVGYLSSDTNYLKSNADDTFTGKLSVGSTNNRSAGMYGTYDSYKIGHIWSMGTAYQIPNDGSDFGNLYGIAYKHTNNATGGSMAGGHQAVFTNNGTAGAAISFSGGIWTSGTLSASGYNDSNWNTAYGWGNHASAGYTGDQDLSSYYGFKGGVAINTNADTLPIGVWKHTAQAGITNFPVTYGTTFSFDTGTYYGWQLSTDSAGHLYNRSKHTIWTDWRTIYDSNNLTNVSQLTNDAVYATQSYVTTSISNLVDSAPGTLDTLNELAAALGDDPNFATTITTSIGNKLPLAGGTMSGKVTFPSAVGNRPQFPGGILGLNTSDGNFDIWGISTDYYPSHGTAANAWGLRWNGDNNDFEFVGGGTNRVILDMDGGNITSTGTITATGGNSTNWNTAYGWGNHAGLYLGATAKAADSNLLDGIDSGSFLRSDANDTASGNLYFSSSYNRFNTGNSNNTSTADTVGVYLHQSGYTDGRWTTRLRKYDHGGGVPLYIDNSAATANVFTAAARFGTYSGNGYTFEVFGSARVGGDFAATGQVNASGGNSTNWNTAYGWGNHANTYSLLNHTHTFASLTSKPTTVSGYGITDMGSQSVSYAATAGSANSVSLTTGRINLLSGAGGASFVANHYSIGVDVADGSWSGPNYGDLIIGYHTGIRLGAAYTGIRFYNNSPTTDTNNDGNGDVGEALIMTVGGAAGSTNVLVAGTISASNFSGTSSGTNTGDQTNISGYAKYLSGANAYTNGSDGWWRSDGAAGWYNGTYAVGIYATEAGNVRTYNGANFISSGTISATNFSGTHSGSSSGTNTGDQTNISGNAATATYATTAGSAPNGSNLNASYGVTAGAGNGLKFWDGSDTYKISMGNAGEYHYGPVTDYSIKTVIDSVGSTRGFTWGVNGATPIAGLNAGNGNMEIAGTFKSTGLTVEGTISGSTVFDVQGTQGQLFSITDDLTGDLFTVSDISGIPILSVNSLGVVTIDDTLRVTGDVIAYAASDSRLKENITPISNPLDKLKLIGGYEFDWNGLSKNNGHDVGVIAQEIELVLPELVGIRGDGYKGVQYDKLTALLIEAVKEQQKQIDELKSKLNK